jgi:cyclopropane fatty-acyl-phospholipid synthase-like methyltransferase
MSRQSLFVVVCSLFALGACKPVEQSPRKADVVYIPSPDEVIEAMLELADVKSTDIVYDLGSGDGSIPIFAAKKYGARGVGIEINRVLVQDARRNAEEAGVSHLVRFIEGDLFEADIAEATVVTLFLLESLNERLQPKLLSSLQPGSRIVSHEFGMGTWKPQKSIEVTRRKVHLWTVPAFESVP